ncbi:hypothetical protein [Flindersiella endophytica]
MIRIETRFAVLSLVWDGDELVDWASGGYRWTLAGEETDPHRSYGFSFDRAIVSPSGVPVVYVDRGTKGYVRTKPRPREINRSFNHAEDYEFPIAAGLLADGREVLVHCPDDYNRLEIEDLATGRRLTTRPGRDDAADVFHTRLALSPGGTWLLSAGWVWHPWGIADVFSVERALADPTYLDEVPSPRLDVVAEVESACWLDADRLVVVGNPEEEPLDDESDGLRPGEIGVWSASAGAFVSRAPLGVRAGVVVPYGTHVLGWYGYPKLIEPSSGEVVEAWPELDSGRRDLPYGVTPVPQPPVAARTDGSAFAVADPAGITVVTTHAWHHR